MRQIGRKAEKLEGFLQGETIDIVEINKRQTCLHRLHCSKTISLFSSKFELFASFFVWMTNVCYGGAQ